MLELHTVWADIEATNEPRILNNHQFFDVQPKDLLAKKLKVVLVYRNPKDVAVSYFHHVKRMEHFYSYEGDFNAFLKRFAEGNLDNNSMFDYLKGWEQGIRDNPSLDVLVLSYDELRHDPLPHLRALAKFLGKDWGDSFLETVLNNTDIEIMQKLKGLWISDDDGVVMHRKGHVGDWKNHFTVAQNEWFDQIINDAMKDSKLFTFKYTL
ncbi:unnamed protein product [Lymnaea stagnalis]|uniref:Sulfotransferase domain-containing protein n=1 Tax=Lymnaea stagnalis TaxID=6523 RepID=A0AAV2HY57_LYMST